MAETVARFRRIGGREIKTRQIQTRIVRGDVCEETACAASHIEHMQLALIATTNGMGPHRL